MNQPTPKDVRNAVILAVLVTALAMLALFDPACQQRFDAPHAGPSRSLSPR